MKKKILGVGLALAMALSMSAFAADSYAVKDAYVGDKDQGPVWYYMYSDDGEATIKELTLHSEWADSWQVNAEDPGSYNYLSMCNWGGVDAQCGSVGGKAYDIILAFKAPADGNAKIGEWNHFGYTNVNEDETYESPNASFKTGKATIMLNKEVLYTGDIKGVDNSGKSSVIEKEVKAGDMIYFVCNGGGNGAALNVSLDSVKVDFTAGAAGGDTNTTAAGSQKNPSTGEAAAALPVMAGVVALVAVVLAKKAKKA